MSDHIQELTRDEILAQMQDLASRELNVSLEEALKQLDQGDLDERIVSSRLRLLRYLLDEPPLDQAAE